MVNLLQIMNPKTLTKDVTTILENTCINDDFDITNWIPNHSSPVMTKGEDAFASDTGTDSNEHCDGEPCQFEQIDDENEFKDTELEDLVMTEGPQQILQLILQEQVDGFMEEEIIDAGDYANWLRWVSDVEQSRQAMYESTHCATIPMLLQVHQVEGGNLDRNSTE
jgi:hypothetical protein